MRRLLSGLVLAGIAGCLFSSSAIADRIVIFGATGNIGTAIVREALDRGHEVVGVSRSPENFAYTDANFTGVAGNPTILESVLEVTAGADSIINAVGGREAATPEETAMVLSAIVSIKAFSGLGPDGPQLVIVGGGLTNHGSAEKVKQNLPPNATPGSPFEALYLGHWQAYQAYLQSNINWTYVRPPLAIIGFGRSQGEDIRTGEYRTSAEGFVYDDDGNNSITKSDLAAAIVDFAELGNFNQTAVSVGY